MKRADQRGRPRATSPFGNACLMACVATMGCGSSGCDRSTERQGDRAARAPSVFIIVLDAASAGFFGCYGDARGASPNIDAFSKECVLFENAYSQTPSTLLSTTSLLTGTRTSTHQMNDDVKLPARLVTLPEVLVRQGGKTCSILGNPYAGSPTWGLDRGYQECVEVYKLPEVVKRRVSEETTAFAVTQPSDINAEVFKRLATWSPTGTFAYIHYLQPHKPYDPPSEFRLKFECGPLDWKAMHNLWDQAVTTGKASDSTIHHLMGRYRANLRYVDASVGELFERMKKAGLYDESLILLTADHGDAFFKHGHFGHNTDLYDDMTRVPLLMKFPKSENVKPARRTNLTETVDLMPTILQYLGIPIPDQAEGESLLNLAYAKVDRLSGEEVQLGAIVDFGTGPGAKTYDKHAIRVRDFKYIVEAQGREELYHLTTDPDEQHNLADSEPKKLAEFRELLRSRVDMKSGVTLVQESRDRSDDRLNRLLNSLGYATGSEKNDATESKTPASDSSAAPTSMHAASQPTNGTTIRPATQPANRP